jgi:hypothetical protein
MPVNEMSDALKAKLYDLRYSPFLLSFFISLAIYNYRFLMILFADNIDLDIKFDKLDNESIGISNVLIPFGVALFYTGIYPIFGNWLYEVTLKYKNDAKRRKIKAEALTIKTQKEYEILEKEKNKLVWDLEEKEKVLSTYRKLYEDKTKSFDEKIEDEKKKIKIEYNKIEKNLQHQINELNTQLSNSSSIEADLQQQLKSTQTTLEKVSKENDILKEANKTLENKEVNIQNLFQKNKNLQKEIEKLKIESTQAEVKKNDFNINDIPPSYKTKFTDDEIKILETIYTNDIVEYTSRDQLANNLRQYLQIPRIKILSIINGLHEKEIIKTQSGNYYITDEGKKDMVNMFDS